jgi:hypothetical protein
MAKKLWNMLTKAVNVSEAEEEKAISIYKRYRHLMYQ